MINVKSAPYGAVGDGTTDDTSHLQLALTTAGTLSTADEVYLPPGTYKITGPLYVPPISPSSSPTTGAPVTIRGAGKWLSQIKLSAPVGVSTAGDGIIVQTTNPVEFSDFGIIADSAKTQGGAMIVVDSNSNSSPAVNGENDHSRFRNLSFVGALVGLDLRSAAGFVVDGCLFYEPTSVGLSIGNSVNADSGDSVVTNSEFYGIGNTTAYAVLYKPAGGLKFAQNKVNGFYGGIVLSLPAGHNTSDLLVVGNSIEGTSNTGILMVQATSGSGTLANVLITGNEIAIATGNCIASFGPSTPWLSNTAICGNTLFLNGALSGGSSLAGVHLESMENLVVSGNAVYGNGANASTFYGVQVLSTCNTGQLGYNTYLGPGTPVLNVGTEVMNHT